MYEVGEGDLGQGKERVEETKESINQVVGICKPRNEIEIRDLRPSLGIGNPWLKLNGGTIMGELTES